MTPSQPSLASRAEQAGGPDRELDAEIAILAGHVVMQGNSRKGWGFFVAPVTKGDWAFATVYAPAERREAINTLSACGHYVPIYTASLDAISSLIAEKLPGWAWGAISEKLRGSIGYVHNNEMHFRGIAASPNPNKLWFECRAKTPALSLCAAFLKAYDSALASTEDSRP